MKHYPVMLPEVLEAMAPIDGEVYIDATFGNGGYSEGLLKSAMCDVIGLDRDPNVASRANELSQQYAPRFRWVQTPFSRMDADIKPRSVDAVVLDIGVSSMQIDQAERGFSFMRSGPLDMRMSGAGPTAADAVNQLSFDELVQIFKVYGEERRARRAAEFIVRARDVDAITTTDSLAGLIEKALGRTGKIHPATRVFQALRIFINDELGELYRGLCAAETILKPDGRLVVVTFHSLEDRLVKQFLRRREAKPQGGSRYQPALKLSGPAASFNVSRRSVVKPSEAETRDNARSRSAKLRCAIRTTQPPFPADDDLVPHVRAVESLEVRP